MSKSYVTMETHRCKVCGKEYQTNNILMDKKLENKFENNTCTGWGLCPEHQTQYDEGYIALIGVDREKSKVKDDTISPSHAYRTGRICHVKKSAFSKIFNVDFDIEDLELTFVEDAVLDQLEQIQQEAENATIPDTA